MSIRFQISALPLSLFSPLLALDSSALQECGAILCVADSNSGYPCRVSLLDAEVGEQLILLPFAHHNVDSPYKASGPIYVRVAAKQACPVVCEVPESVRRRLLSARAYDATGEMINADVVPGQQLERAIETFFANPRVAYIHLHNAKPGCYNCRVDRV